MVLVDALPCIYTRPAQSDHAKPLGGCGASLCNIAFMFNGGWTRGSTHPLSFDVAASDPVPDPTNIEHSNLMDCLYISLAAPRTYDATNLLRFVLLILLLNWP